jgi:ribonuclease Z
VPCVGYAFSQRSKALRPEFDELRRRLVRDGRGQEFGRVMARKREEGVEVDAETRRPLFAWSCPTAGVNDDGRRFLS